MKILITGDCVINQPYPLTKIGEQITRVFKDADYNIVNLEAPVTDSTSTILKTGPHLKADKKSTLEVLKLLKIDLVTLANNHVLDYDQQGVLDTLSFCHENNISTVGAGRSQQEAAKIFYLESDVGRISIINISENEWASATETTAGANGMDLIDDIRQIQEAAKKSDFVFVIVHGGHLFYNLPSPRMQKQYRFYIDNGADLVIGHHTHCISGFEEYNGKSIYYSLGNFVFTKSFKQKNSNKGLILEIELIKTTNSIVAKTKSIPILLSKDDFSIYLPDNQEENEIQEEIQNYNLIISSFEELNAHWEKHILKSKKIILNNITLLSGIKNKYFKAVLNKLNVYLINKKYASSLFNHMNCESHLELTKAVLKKKLEK